MFYLYAFISVYHVYAWYPRKPGVTAICEPFVSAGNRTWVASVLASEASLQPLQMILLNMKTFLYLCVTFCCRCESHLFLQSILGQCKCKIHHQLCCNFFTYCTKLSFNLFCIVERYVCLVPHVKVKRSSLRLAVLRFKLVWVLPHPVRVYIALLSWIMALWHLLGSKDLIELFQVQVHSDRGHLLLNRNIYLVTCCYLLLYIVIKHLLFYFFFKNLKCETEMQF